MGKGFCPLEIFLRGLSFPAWCLWLAGRAGSLGWVEVKAPAQQISKSMKREMLHPACHLAKATTSLSPDISWLVPKYPQVPICPMGSQAWMFKGKSPFGEASLGVIMWKNWGKIGNFGVLNMDCWEWGTG